MQRLFLLALLLWLSGAQVLQSKPQHALHRRVNPFIGTGGHGHTFPGPVMPFGACQLSPDTRLEGWDGCSGYHYSDSVIYGFSHTHLSGTGCSDYGDILLMPVARSMRLDKYQYASRFRHETEKAHAGIYEVMLDDPGVKAELTTTLHGGVHRYTFPQGVTPRVVLDLKHRDERLDSKMEQVDAYTLRGYRYSKAWARLQRVYFEIRFNRPIEGIEYEPLPGASPTQAIELQKSGQCLITLSEGSGPLLLRCAISGVDEAGAHRNLEAEMPHADFDRYREAAEAAWDQALGCVTLPEEVPADQDIIFQTALYHCMVHPSLYSDVDGRYRGRDDRIHSTGGKFDYYTVFSLWDTYRALHPLLTLIDPKRTNDFIQTFIRQYEEGGRLPVWELSSNETNCMIGYHVVSVIWDAYNRGIRNYDAEKAYEAMTRIATHFSDYSGEGLSLMMKPEAKKRAADAEALESYCRFGYVRSDDAHESVSKTLEYAYNDWCIAQMAKALKKTKDYEYYMQRSRSWMNVYDPTTGFMRARKNGSLYEPFSPYTVDNNFTEANSWQYSFYVPHDLKALVHLSGGVQGFGKKLDELFAAKTQTEGREQADITGLIGQYAHGNEPSHHIAYLYDLIGQPRKSAAIRSRIVKEFYRNAPDGLIGNEDCGQMSAWYVCNALGYYPVCPGSEGRVAEEANAYVAPLYDGINLLTRDSLHFVFRQPAAGEQGLSPLPFLRYMTHNANSGAKVIRGTHYSQPAEWYPKGLYPGLASVNPFIRGGQSIFRDSLRIDMASANPKATLYYTLNGGTQQRYTGPFTIRENSSLQFFAREYNMVSKVQQAAFTQLPTDRHIYLANKYNPSYHAGGAQGLMDGLYGKTNWRAGDWQGYQGQDIEVVMAFDSPRTLNRVGANFLEDQNSWIFYPKEVSFYVSSDSVQWTLVERIPTGKSDHELAVTITKFQSTKLPAAPVRFVKVSARHFGAMPQWHEGRGNPTFIFIDEVEAE